MKGKREVYLGNCNFELLNNIDSGTFSSCFDFCTNDNRVLSNSYIIAASKGITTTVGI